LWHLFVVLSPGLGYDGHHWFSRWIIVSTTETISPFWYGLSLEGKEDNLKFYKAMVG